MRYAANHAPLTVRVRCWHCGSRFNRPGFRRIIVRFNDRPIKDISYAANPRKQRPFSFSP